jgi:phage recombination protein Bet
MADRFGVDQNEMMVTLKATAFKGNVSDAQMQALLIVADQYGLNPWTKEIYAFPDKNNGIVPVVGVDGWSRIMNEHPMFDGMEFEQDADSCTCKMYRKDRSRAVSVTEYMSECKRNAGPWLSHPKRMLRHKAMIQCARLAFGFVGIYDEDEAQRIVEKDVTPQAEQSKKEAPAELPGMDAKDFETKLPTYAAGIQAGRTTADQVISKLATKYSLSQEQIQAIQAAEAIEGEVV